MFTAFSVRLQPGKYNVQCFCDVVIGDGVRRFVRTTLIRMAAEVDTLQAALQTAFEESPISPTPLSKSESSLPSGQEGTAESPQILASAAEITSAQDEEWKQEYERQQAVWRTESAVTREKAEANRERWSKIREKEELERDSQPKDAAQSNTTPSQPITSPTIGPASVQLSSTSIVTTEATVTGEAEALSSSRTWEEVPSLASSFPSFSLRESSSGSHEHPELPPYLPPPKPSSVTLAIFNSSLSKRARMLAFVSSVAINLFLPFVNGVMLGFGEIFAKNIVVGYFGWDIPGPGVGIRTRVKSRI